MFHTTNALQNSENKLIHNIPISENTFITIAFNHKTDSGSAFLQRISLKTTNLHNPTVLHGQKDENRNGNQEAEDRFSRKGQEAVVGAI